MQKQQKVYSSNSQQLCSSHSVELQNRKAESRMEPSPDKQKAITRSKPFEEQISTNPTKTKLKRINHNNFRLKMYSTPLNKPLMNSHPSFTNDKPEDIDADLINVRFIEKEVFLFMNEELELGYHAQRKGIKGTDAKKQK